MEVRGMKDALTCGMVRDILPSYVVWYAATRR